MLRLSRLVRLCLSKESVRTPRKTCNIHRSASTWHNGKENSSSVGKEAIVVTEDGLTESSAANQRSDLKGTTFASKGPVQSRLISNTLTKLVQDIYFSSTPALHAFELASYVKRVLNRQGAAIFVHVFDLKPALRALRSVIAQDGSNSLIRTEIRQVEALLSKHLLQQSSSIAADLEMRLLEHDVILDEAEMSIRLKDGATDSAWTHLLSDSSGEIKAQDLWSYRKPSSGDVKNAIAALLQRDSRYRRPDSNFHSAVLQVVMRNVPLCIERPSRTNRLLKIDLDNVRLRWEDLASTDQNDKDAPLSVDKNYPTLQPTTGLGLFKRVWSRMHACSSPTAESYATALALETRLATWRVGALRRARQLTAKDRDEHSSPPTSRSAQGLSEKRIKALDIHPWDPVRDLCRAVALSGQLGVQHVNKVLEGVLQNEPLDVEDPENDPRWPDLRHTLAVFHVLHTNAARQRTLDSFESYAVSDVSTQTEESVNVLLGTSSVDLRTVMPDRATYEIMMRGFSSRGDLEGALATFEQMTGSSMKDFPNATLHDCKHNLYPTPRTFEALLYGFAKYGQPSTLVKLNKDDMNSSNWQLAQIDGTDDIQDSPSWTIDQLSEVIDALLALRYDNDHCRGNVVSQAGSPENSESEVSDNFQQKVQGRSPSSHALFNLLIALRRVSNDQADWVLYKFGLIEDKFSQANETSAVDVLLDEQKWIGWRPNERVNRILEMLKKMKGD